MYDAKLMDRTAGLARAYLENLEKRPVGHESTHESLRTALGGSLTNDGVPAEKVIEDLARGVEPGLVAHGSPRFFGFVIGGAQPVSLAADWLTSSWDQNTGLFAATPAAAVVEEVAREWLLDLFRLPPSCGLGFVTGGQMANFTCLAAARHAVLRRARWDVEADGLIGAPPIHVVVGEEAHLTVFTALRYLGLGERKVLRVPVDGQGRMRPDELARVLATLQGPVIVCAQVGNVNTGALDPIVQIAEVTSARGAWLHIDGAFGLWAATVSSMRAQTEGWDRADSWAVDAHKWLNVPYDCGIAIVKDAAAHRAAMSGQASYLMHTEGRERDPLDWVPELSRRARGFTVYATLRFLGRRGVVDLVERCCRLARRMADRLRADPRVTVLNEVVLNQVLVRFRPRGGGDPDSFTRAVVDRVRRDGVCWMSGGVWRNQAVMRISVSNWSTTEADADRSADAVLTAAWAVEETIVRG